MKTTTKISALVLTGVLLMTAWGSGKSIQEREVK